MTLPLEINGTEVMPRISDYVDRFAAERPEAIAVVCGDRRVSYGNLREQVDIAASGLLSHGIGHGDRVAMLAPPSLEFWIVFLATAKVGAIWVGLNPRYSLPECNYVLSDAEPKLLIVARSDGDPIPDSLVANIAEDNPELEILQTPDPDAGDEPLGALSALANDVDEDAVVAAASQVNTTDPCLIVYTSGSTGQPKGPLLTHYGLSFGATMQTQHFGVDDPSLVVAFPINHVASVADTCATTLVRGGKIVFLPRFDPVKTVNATRDEGCTLMGGVPTMYQMQLAAPGFSMSDLDGVELMLWGGAAMPADIVTRLKDSGARLITAYGMTETATHITYTDKNASLDELTTSVGKPDANCQIRIDGDPDESGIVSGEVQVKADFLLAGYWRREAATRDAFTGDGWFRTGDLGYFRTDGNLCLVGRLSEMFKSGGYNVYPREIETVLEAHPDVELAAVVARPDPLYQEVGSAWVQRRRDSAIDADGLNAWCRERLANYKIPKEFRIVDDLPLLPVGKVDKTALKAAATES